jgi:formylglycine-generating enzyme required for sulfatase activity/energy-coupling factor transporter ATP-binding protein EcfA2
MTEPDPSSPDLNKSVFTALIDAFKGLPPILSFVGLITVIGVLILSLTGVLPEIFLIYPAIGLATFLVYAYLTNRHEMDMARLRSQQEAESQRQEHELERLRLEQAGDLERERLRQETGLKKAELKARPQLPDPKPAEPEPPSTASWPESYYGLVWDKCVQLHMTSIDRESAKLGAAVLELHKVFTTLDVPADPDVEEAARRRQESPDAARDGRMPALQALSRRGNERLVLLGQPGSGKSTLVKYLGLCLSGAALGKAEANLDSLTEQGWRLPPLLPILVVLREYAAKGLSKKHDLWAFIAAGLRDEGLAGCIQPLKDHLKEQGGILLLDGLDEVPEARDHREHLRKSILQFGRDFPKARILVTSRPYAYQDPNWQLPEFNQTTLLDFSPKQIESYVDRWYGVAAPLDPNLGEERARQYAAQLNNQVKLNPNLRELAPRPLLLALMVSLHRWRGGGLLPERREQLYDESVNLLLDLWQRPKLLLDEQGLPRQEEKNALQELGIDAIALRRALSRLAFEAHRDQAEAENGTADIPHEKLVAALHQAVPKEKRDQVPYQRIAGYVRDRAGLLEDRGEDVYGFPHRTFQEYLAAMHLKDQTDFPENIVRLVREDPVRWREATLLAGNSTDTRLKWFLVEQLYERRPPPRADETVGETQWQGVFLAGQVLHDSGLLEDEAPFYAGSRDQVRQWHKAILTRGALPPRDRARAGDLLAEMGDDRPGVLSCDEMPLCYVPPGDFWMADEEKSRQGRVLGILDKPYWLAQYPVTVAQFREFVRDSNHKPAYEDRPLAFPNNRPVVFVNWYDALAFCAWLDRRWRPHLPPGYRVTLPNEAEWEKAARGGLAVPAEPHVTTVQSLGATLAAPPAVVDNPLPEREYPWGDEPEAPEATGEPYRANNEAAAVGRATAVGSFPAGAGPLGGLDMSGNVWEWTRSYYDKKRPYRISTEYETTSLKNREPVLLCGGAFWSDYIGCSARNGDVPGVHFYDAYGFRVAVSPFVSDH